MNLSENAKKYLGWGLVATGVGIGGYAIYKFSKGKKKTTKKKKSLSGVKKKGVKTKTKTKKLHLK